MLPALLTGLTLGLGLLLEQTAGRRLPDALLVPAGLAALIAIASLAVAIPDTARLATPLVVCLAVAGLVVSRAPWRRFDGWATGAAAVVFGAFGAPVILAGEPTFAGYIKLDDTATFLALADRVLEHGRSLGGLAPSTYEATLAVNLGHGYPVGAVLPLGIGGQLLREDVAWLYQPWLSFGAAALTLALYHVVRPLVPTRPLAAAAAALGSLSALLYGFALWGGIKELAVAPLIVVAAALAGGLGRSPSVRALIPLAVACAAVLDTVSAAGAVWLLPMLTLLRAPPRRIAAAAAVGALLALPAIVEASTFLRATNRASFENASELGNLVRPLRLWQVAGVWLGGDFRVDPGHLVLTVLVALLVLAGGAAAVVLAARRGARSLLLALASAALGAAVFALVGSPWVGAKALAVASPVVLAAAFAGWLGVADRAARRAGAASALLVSGATFAVAALGVAVVWSDVLGYHDAWLAPQPQLAELERIGSRFAGQGPALMTEYQPYGVRHFLRRLDAEGASELRWRLVPLRGGRVAPKGVSVDLDEIEPEALDAYPTLVLRRSPTASRPPASYRLAWRGRWYEVWQRPDGGRHAIAHLPLGGGLQPGAVPACTELRRLATRGPLAAVPRTANVAVTVAAAGPPAGWTVVGGGALLPRASGTIALTVTAPRTGRYRLWVGGSLLGKLRARIDGRPAGEAGRHLQTAGQWLQLGALRLSRGPHRLELTASLAPLSPGTGSGAFPLGPALLEPRAPRPVLRPPRADALCGRRLDWVEALAPGR